MGFKCGDEVIILINGGEVRHGIMQEDYKYLEVYVGVWGDSRTYDFYHGRAIAKLNIELVDRRKRTQLRVCLRGQRG